MRAACLALLVIACGPGAAAPAEYPRLPRPAGQAPRTDAEPEREPLAAGARLITQRSASPIVTFRVVFSAGSAADGPGREGITMLTARLMAEGGAGELSYAELSQRLYPMAARLDVHVGRDQTAFVGQVHRDHLEEFYSLFRDVLSRPRMAQGDFTRIRDQMRHALTVELRGADDEELGKETLQAMLYEGHPYGHPALGTEAGLARIQVDDARAHRGRVLCAGRSLAGIAGDVPEGFEQRVQRDVDAIRSASCVGRETLPAPPRVEAPRIWIVHRPEAAATAVSMGFPIEVTRDHPDYPALVLATAWLGQHRQFVGRLMQAIRGERGLNYGDYAYPEHFTQMGWTRFPVTNDARRQQYFSIWLRPLRPDQAHFAIRLAVRELRRLHERGLSEEELTSVRNFADAYFALNLQTAAQRLGYAIDDAFYGVDRPYLERLRAAWSALTREELDAVIRRHLDPSRLQIAIVAADAEALADRLAQETESPITYRSSVPARVLEEDREIVGYRLGIARERIRVVPAAELFAR
ncbi:MAG: insulinase family protein [Sandaracinaceae bacterium]|nr:insulinase family protein [Sandaracinaceae bacterium]